MMPPEEARCLGLRACANRRVAYVARSSKKAIESLLPLSSTKSCQPIGAASKDHSVSEVGECPPAGASTLLELLVGDEQGHHEAGGEEVEAHYQGGNGQHLARVVYAPLGTLGVVLGPAHKRHRLKDSLTQRLHTL